MVVRVHWSIRTPRMPEGLVGEIRENFARRDRILGEFVLVIGSADVAAGYGDIRVSSTGLRGMGLAGTLDFADIAWVTLVPGSGADRVWLDSVPYMVYPEGYGRTNSYLRVNNLSGDDVVYMTPAVGDTSWGRTWRLNDVYADQVYGVGVVSDSFTVPSGGSIGTDFQVYDHTTGTIAAVWASSGQVEYVSQEPSSPIYNYRWQSTTGRSEDVTIYVRDNPLGLVTASRFHVTVSPYAAVDDQTGTEGTVALSGSFGDSSHVAGMTYAAAWRVTDRATGALVQDGIDGSLSSSVMPSPGFAM